MSEERNRGKSKGKAAADHTTEAKKVNALYISIGIDFGTTLVYLKDKI